ncbi:MAG: M48 family metallopeptidase [Nanoarchaeota archaeon]|nr:M48 family metallopeptidase [Nanoarchaeota archaeon]
MANFFDEIRKNKIKSILLIFLVIPFFILLAYAIAEIYNPEMTFFFMTIASLIAITQILISYYHGDKIVLKITGAKPATKPKYTKLINIVEGLSIAAGIPPPKVYVIENPDINAFATGRDPQHASIAVTTGLLEKLNKEEIEGVIGHELSHIKNFDIRFMTLVSVIVGLVVIISNMFLRSLWFRNRDRNRSGGIFLLIGLALAIIAPIAVKLIQLAISRKREFLADASSAQLTRYPEGLASALEKIKNYNAGKLQVSDAVAPLFIAEPKKSWVANLFSTHPPIEERIKRLREM